MTPHLTAIKARVRKLAEYHKPRLGVKAEIYVVDALPRDASGCCGCAFTTTLFFREDGKWILYKPHIRLKRSCIEKRWDNPGWLDDLVVHELMHFTVDEGRKGRRRVVHGPLFRKKMMEYGYHPDANGWDPERRVPALED